MFTYIMPTILKSDKWRTQLPNVFNHPLIEKVMVVIDLQLTDEQADEVTKEFYNIDTNQKLQILITSGGKFCNGSWNFAIENGEKTDYLIFANDDIIFDTKVFDEVAKLDLKNFGIIGAGNQYRNVISRTHGFGQLMFMYKHHYTTIPDGIKHWFGDDWLFYQMSLVGMPNFTYPIQIFTNFGESSDSEVVKERIRLDFEYWDTIKEPFIPFFYHE